VSTFNCFLPGSLVALEESYGPRLTVSPLGNDLVLVCVSLPWTFFFPLTLRAARSFPPRREVRPLIPFPFSFVGGFLFLVQAGRSLFFLLLAGGCFFFALLDLIGRRRRPGRPENCMSFSEVMHISLSFILWGERCPPPTTSPPLLFSLHVRPLPPCESTSFPLPPLPPYPPPPFSFRTLSFPPNSFPLKAGPISPSLPSVISSFFDILVALVVSFSLSSLTRLTHSRKGLFELPALFIVPIPSLHQKRNTPSFSNSLSLLSLCTQHFLFFPLPRLTMGVFFNPSGPSPRFLWLHFPLQKDSMCPTLTKSKIASWHALTFTALESPKVGIIFLERPYITLRGVTPSRNKARKTLKGISHVSLSGESPPPPPFLAIVTALSQ